MSWEKSGTQNEGTQNESNFVFWSISSYTLFPWSPGAQAAHLSFLWSKWAGGKNLRKNLMSWPTFIFWSISSDTLVPWSPWSPGAQQCTGSLSQLPVHEMNWGKKFKTKPSVLINFCFLVNFITHTGPMVWSPWSPGAQAAYLSLHWLKWARGKTNQVFCFLVNFIFIKVYFLQIYISHLISLNRKYHTLIMNISMV